MDLGNQEKEVLVEVQKPRLIYLCAIGFAPTVAATLGLFCAESAWTAILLLHLSMLSLPLAFLLASDSLNKSLLKGETENLSRQLRIGASLLALSVLTAAVSLTALLSVPGMDLPQLLGFAQVTCDYFLFNCNSAQPILCFAAYFSVVNPVAEEAFWRLFLYKTLPRTEAWKWGVSLMYASYHVVVVLKFSGLWQALLCATLVPLFGRILVLVRESSGLVAGTLLHCGVDLGIIGSWLYLLFLQ